MWCSRCQATWTWCPPQRSNNASRKALSEPGAHVTLDLSDLEFVDSAGVSVLIKAKQDAESHGRTLVLARATEQVHRVFALVGLADWLTG